MSREAGLFYNVKHSTRMLCGVCAEISDRSTVPVWLVRTVAILLLLMHPPLMVALYLCAALWMRGERRGTWQARAMPAAPAWDRDGLTERFSRLDRRLAGMERAALDREMGLRAAFRDLEK
jgi:phage shock protein PspC (stress-responsive transcriptional regulator)